MTSLLERRKANLNAGNEVRQERARQRRELIGAPMRVVIPAIVRPTSEFGSYRLSTLFAPDAGHQRGLIPGVGQRRLRKSLAALCERNPHGRFWHSHLRLRELSEPERRRLLAELVSFAPSDWREAA